MKWVSEKLMNTTWEQSLREHIRRSETAVRAIESADDDQLVSMQRVYPEANLYAA